MTDNKTGSDMRSKLNFDWHRPMSNSMM